MAETAIEAVARGEVSKFLTLCKDRREQVAVMIDALDKAGFYSAPASAMYHNNFQGGLAAHVINVTKVLLLIKRRLFNEKNEFPVELFPFNDDQMKLIQRISDESCVIVGLFHDVHKCSDGFGRENYLPNVLKSGQVSAAKPYETNKEIIALCGGYKSAMIVSKFVDLYEHEIQAICCHDGQYVPENKSISQKEHPLTLMLHFADMFSASQIENNESGLYRPVSVRYFLK